MKTILTERKQEIFLFLDCAQMFNISLTEHELEIFPLPRTNRKHSLAETIDLPIEIEGIVRQKR